MDGEFAAELAPHLPMDRGNVDIEALVGFLKKKRLYFR